MGAWDEKNFGNDSAMDWVGEFEENPSIKLLKSTIQEVIKENDYIDSDIGCECLAAAEIIAAIKGKKSSDFPDELNPLLTNLKLIDGLDKLAIKAINKIKGEDSELAELWGEVEENNQWLAIIDDLIFRLE